MTGKTKTRPFDPAEYLSDDEAIAAYIEEALEAGLGRESLYKALSSDGNPEFATVLRVLKALGLRLSVSPIAADQAAE
jgi:DNA-binding phage protein